MMHGETDNDLDVIVIDDPWTEFASTSKEVQAPSSINKNYAPSKYARWPAWAAATFLTLIVHSLVIGPFLLGSSARKHQRPMTEGGEASAQQSTAGEFVSHLILINDHGADTSEEINESPYVVSQQKQPEKFQQELAILSSTPQIEIAGSEEGTDATSLNTEAVGDAAGRAMLFGRYMGQIKARIERAWIYPTPSSIASFKCNVQIKQSQQGNVLEVTMTRCINDAAWQLSLAKAIQAASPLPAPPDENVFTNVVTLNISAMVSSN